MKRALVIVLSQLLLFPLLCAAALAADPVAYEYNGQKYVYAQYIQLKTFLNLPSAVQGKTNGQTLNDNYDEADPTSWTGVTWGESSGTPAENAVTGLEWFEAGDLKGSLYVSSFSDLGRVLLYAEGITGLDFSGCSNLAYLQFGKTQITSLDLTGLSSLTQLYCGSNKKLASLNLTGCTALRTVRCNGNALTSLDLSPAGTFLQQLDCNDNKLTSLNVSKNTALEGLNCSANQLASLNLTGYSSLEDLNCSENPLATLTVTGCTSLDLLQCTKTSLTSLVLTDNTALTELWCNMSKLSALNVRPLANLKSLHCDDNELQTLDVSQNTALATLSCSSNKLKTLNVSQNTQLGTLFCANTGLTSLNLNTNTALKELNCSSASLTELTVNGCTLLERLDCSKNALSALTLTANTQLRSVVCNDNLLQTLDLRANSKLSSLSCQNNKLTTLLLGSIPLAGLACSSNALTSLDLSAQTKLQGLDCSSNQLQTLDTKASNLMALYCSANKLTSIRTKVDGNAIHLTAEGNGYVELVRGMDYDEEKMLPLYINAIPKSGSRFVKWLQGTEVYATAAKVTIDPIDSVILTAQFGVGTYTVAVSASNSAWGTVTGAGTYTQNATATVTATPKSGYRFVRWLEGSTAVSTNASYSFQVTKARTLKAEFAAIGAPVVTIKSTYNTATLTWKAVTGAAGYEVYRAASGGTYTKLATVTSASYTNSGLTTGKAYTYKVRAKCVSSTATTYGIYSSVVSVTPSLGTPQATAVSTGYTSVKLTWSKVAGATGYRLYRATSKSGTYTKVAETTSTSITNKSLTTGKTYYYKVRAIRTASGTTANGSYSSIVSAKPIPAAPTGVTTTRVSNSSLKVSWSKVSGTTKYQVYRATSLNGTYAKVAETTSLSYTNKGLQDNKTYYYKVRAYHTEGVTKVYGAYSTIVNAKP